jgi:TIR domain
MFLKTSWRITSDPPGAEIYVSVWGEWKYLGKTPYDFELARDRGGWLNPTFRLQKEGYLNREDTIDRATDKDVFHYSLNPVEQAETTETPAEVTPAETTPPRKRPARKRKTGRKPSSKAEGIKTIAEARSQTVSALPQAEMKAPVPDAETQTTDPSLQNYLFVSYKREDFDRISDALDFMQECGYRIWYDKGIPGGAEWDALIEERLTNSKIVLLFVSQRAIESKWARREAKYADSKGKPMLPIFLEEVKLRYGMEMLFSQYQRLDARTPDFKEQLRNALKFLVEMQNDSSQ